MRRNSDPWRGSVSASLVPTTISCHPERAKSRGNLQIFISDSPIPMLTISSSSEYMANKKFGKYCEQGGSEHDTYVGIMATLPDHMVPDNRSSSWDRSDFPGSVARKGPKNVYAFVQDTNSFVNIYGTVSSARDLTHHLVGQADKGWNVQNGRKKEGERTDIDSKQVIDYIPADPSRGRPHNTYSVLAACTWSYTKKTMHEKGVLKNDKNQTRMRVGVSFYIAFLV